MLTPWAIRNLGQREYEKRKQAALEIETAVRDLSDAGDFDKINTLVSQIVNDLVESAQPNMRKGALHAHSQQRN